MASLAARKASRAAAAKACKTNNDFLISEAIDAATDAGNVMEILSSSFGSAVRHRSMQVLNWLFSHHRDCIQDIQPTDIAVRETGRVRKKSRAPIQLLDKLHQYGYDINSFGVPYKNLGPLLWLVCDSPKLVKWCLEHGANLTIPCEITSVDSKVGDIYHTPRHPLLLEMVAAYGSVSTFKKLLRLGAPLTPGPSWHQDHAPKILHHAILSAVQTAPYGRTLPSRQHQNDLKMIRFLVDDLKLDVNGIAIRAVDMIDDLKLHPCHMQQPGPALGEQRNLRELVKILLDKGAYLGLQNSKDRRFSTPLICAYHGNPESFTKAVKSWQDSEKKAARSIAAESPGLAGGRIVKTPDLATSIMEQLPLEILEMVGGYLGLEDLRNCRLTTRRVSSGMFQSFRFYLGEIRTTFNIQDLTTTIEHVEEHKTAGYVIDEIIFSPGGVASTHLSDSANEQAVLDLLIVLFTAIKQQLRSMTISTKGSGFRLALQALQETGVNLQALNLHSIHDPVSMQFLDDTSIELYASALNDWSRIFSSIQQLTWSFCCQGFLAFPTVIHHILNLTKVLSFVPKVDTLVLSYTRLDEGGPIYRYFSDSIITALGDTKLKECSLTGITVTENILRQFLEQTTATRMTLKRIYMRIGKYQSVLDILASGKFEYLHLEDLYERRSAERHYSVRFDVAGKIDQPYDGYGPRRVVREGREARRKLEYRCVED